MIIAMHPERPRHCRHADRSVGRSPVRGPAARRCRGPRSPAPAARESLRPQVPVTALKSKKATSSAVPSRPGVGATAIRVTGGADELLDERSSLRRLAQRPRREAATPVRAPRAELSHARVGGSAKQTGRHLPRRLLAVRRPAGFRRNAKGPRRPRPRQGGGQIQTGPLSGSRSRTLENGGVPDEQPLGGPWLPWPLGVDLGPERRLIPRSPPSAKRRGRRRRGRGPRGGRRWP